MTMDSTSEIRREQPPFLGATTKQSNSYYSRVFKHTSNPQTFVEVENLVRSSCPTALVSHAVTDVGSSIFLRSTLSTDAEHGWIFGRKYASIRVF